MQSLAFPDMNNAVDSAYGHDLRGHNLVQSELYNENRVVHQNARKLISDEAQPPETQNEKGM